MTMSGCMRKKKKKGGSLPRTVTDCLFQRSCLLENNKSPWNIGLIQWQREVRALLPRTVYTNKLSIKYLNTLRSSLKVYLIKTTLREDLIVGANAISLSKEIVQTFTIGQQMKTPKINKSK